MNELQRHFLEIATAAPDARPAIWMKDLVDADFFRLKLPRSSNAPAQIAMEDVGALRVLASREVKDTALDKVSHQQL